MKKYFYTITAFALLLAIIFNICGCAFFENIRENGNGDSVNPDNSTENSNTPEDNSNKDDIDSPNDNGNSDTESKLPDSTDKDNTGSGSNTPGTSETPEDPTKPNTIKTTSLPHYDYSNGSADTYNTDLFYQNSYEVALGDPSVYYEENENGKWFYVTGTTTGASFEMWKTQNFTDWEKVGTIYTPPENFFGKSSFWAPQLTYDPDAEWDYYLGEDAGGGKGLYILFFSARKSNNVCCPSVAFSKKINGPYKNFVGTNKNDDKIDESNPLFDIEKLNGLGLYENHAYGALYKKNRSFIDACPYVDPITNDKYLYMVRNRIVDTSNDVWGVKMKDWVTPDYQTTTPLSSYGYTTIDKTEEYSFKSKNNIDEGPFMYYKDNSDDGIDNGKYYLTFSIGDTNDKLYPVCQAIGDSPLGPFTKIQKEKGGLLMCPGDTWDIHGSGHHAFFEVEGELFAAYHTYVITTGSSIGKRYFAFSKVEWVYNEDGQYIMRANGPSKSTQPLPSAVSGYSNIAPFATVDATNQLSDSRTEYLTDGLIALSENDVAKEFKTNENSIITLTFDEYVTARALLIYNSYSFDYAFSSIDKIELSYRKLIDGRIYYGTAVISSLGFSFRHHLIPAGYLSALGETDLYQMRPMGAAIAEFGEIEINSIKLYMNTSELIGISEITVLGKLSSYNLSSYSGYGGYTKEYVFPSYEKFNGTMDTPAEDIDSTVKIDGVLDEKIWTESKTKIIIEGATVDQTTGEPVDVSVFGEREATVYTYIGKRTVFFAFEVIDKNLYFNDSLPQGRSTCVEIYFTDINQSTLSKGCYSIRINPTGESGEAAIKLRTYVPNAAGNEWRYVSFENCIRAAIKVNGIVQNSPNDENYTTENNYGYIVEMAIDKILLGLDENSLKFTAAFVQDQGYYLPRINNSFIKGTKYTDVQTWIIMTNDGRVHKEEETQ